MKHMKKTMFITTLIMIVVLVVALSTATFAWYSASTQVSAAPTDLMSAFSSSAAIALDKVAIIPTSTGTTATFTTNAITGPMVPTINPIAGSTTYSDFAESFMSAGINTHNYFTANAIAATPSTIASVAIDDGAASNQTLFYVGNTNPGSSPTIQMHAVIATTGNIYVLLSSDPGDMSTNYANYYTKNPTTGAYTALNAEATYAANTYYKAVPISANLAGCLRIAIFIDGVYATTYGNAAAATNVGDEDEMVQGAYAQYDSENHGTSGYGIAAQYNCIAQATETTVKACSGVQSASIAWVAWFDGCQLTSEYAGAAAQFSFVFSVATV